jgi:hypothetical protein
VSVVGVTWADPAAAAQVEIRTQRGGVWGPWEVADSNPQEGPDPSSAEGKAARGGTDPVVVTGAEQVQARVVGAGAVPTSLALDVVDPGDAGETSSTTAPTSPTSSSARSTRSSRSVSRTALSSSVSTAPAYAATTYSATTTYGAARPTIYSRAQWGADESMRKGEPSYGAVKMAFVHHTVDANNYTAAQVPAILRSIYAFHVNGRGWSDIGYNFLVDRFGRIWEGRYGGVDRAVIGAHTRGYNSYAFAMSAIGNYDIAPVPAAVVSAYQRLFAWKATVHQFDPAGYAHIAGKIFRAVSGHRDAGQTACPGRYLYAQIPAIRSGAAALRGYLPALTLNRDVDNEEHPDVRGIDASGALQRYSGNGSGDMYAAQTIGTGWQGFDRLIVPGDWTGDSVPDLLARKQSTGELYLYESTGTGGFRSGVRIGTGWNGLEVVTGVGDFNGDGHVDLVARHANGDLYLFRGNGHGGFLANVRIGYNWQAMNALAGVGDWDGDGHVDLVARNTSGVLYLYRGAGGYRFASNAVVGPGWQDMTAIIGAGDTDNDGTTDLYARKPDGSVALYRKNGDPMRWSRTDVSTNLGDLRVVG